MATESWVVAGPQIIEIEAITQLQVQLEADRVDVVAHDGPGARVEVHGVDGRPLEITLSDGELRVGYQFTLGGWEGFLEKFRNFGGKDKADVHIAVPREVRARLGTVKADGLLAGTRGGRLGLHRLRHPHHGRHARTPRRQDRVRARSSSATTVATSS